MSSTKSIEEKLRQLDSLDRSPLDLLPQQEFAEKLIHLELHGVPEGVDRNVAARLGELASSLSEFNVRDAGVVVLGGGTGLSNILGGDSRKETWPVDPFSGLKEVFPGTRAIVCVTDDGGSTGELLKDLPFIALGDLRHVLLSSLRKERLQQSYSLDNRQCQQVAAGLHKLFNYRFDTHPCTVEDLTVKVGLDSAGFPGPMHEYFTGLLRSLFDDPGLSGLFYRPHCLGNLLLAAAIWQAAPELHDSEHPCLPFDAPNYKGLKELSRVMGLDEDAAMPCSLTPAGLQLMYSNGALVTGEYKSGYARRGYPVDRLFVRFVEEPQPVPEVMDAILSADIIILAPGSLYTSTIPIFQTPGLAEAVRSNSRALKILAANLWVQKGETDLVRDDPGRRFYVSDLIKAYNRNIPGGVRDLFSHVLSLGLRDISGSILQSYATEDKVPIFLDRENVTGMGLIPVEAGIYSQSALKELNVIQHDQAMLARAVRTLYAVAGLEQYREKMAGRSSDTEELPGKFNMGHALVQKDKLYPCQRYAALKGWLEGIIFSGEWNRPGESLAEKVLGILWYHQDILLAHLENIRSIRIISRKEWSRSQEWDNVCSFFDPEDSTIKICDDVAADDHRFEQAFLVALGQALLGAYAASKEMAAVEEGDESLGRVYRLIIKPPEEFSCFFSIDELAEYLQLARMNRSGTDRSLFTRLVNGKERFTPPGLLFGLIYAWYLDNRFATHVEYKMAIMRTDVTDLIPEQVRMCSRRRSLVHFFRKSVFRHISPLYDEKSQKSADCSKSPYFDTFS